MFRFAPTAGGIVVIAAVAAAPAFSVDGDLTMQTVRPVRSSQACLNPGMGLYLAGGSGVNHQPIPADAWFWEIADIVYFRPGWSDVQPQPGTEGFDAYFGPLFDYYVNRLGKRLAFRVMSESMHSSHKYVTPKWVFDLGAPSVIHRGLRAEEQVDPVFWDERYLESACKFTRELGAYLDGRKGLEYVDIGAIGEWGEMHLGLHIPGRWTPEQLEQAGYTETKYIAAYRRIIDAFAESFRKTPVFLNVGHLRNVCDYAARRGLHFRQDGLTPSGPSADVGKALYHPYAPMGVRCNYEFHSGLAAMKQKGWDLQTTIDKGLEDPISYLNTNVLSPAQLAGAPQDVRHAFRRAAMRVGCRLVLTEIEIQRQIHLRGDVEARLLVRHRWRNDGVAPCYESLALDWVLLDAQGRELLHQRQFPQTPTTLWHPNETEEESVLLRVPGDIEPQPLTLSLAVVDPEGEGPPWQLGIEGRDDRGRYHLAVVEAVKAPRAEAVVHRQSFGEVSSLWSPTEGMQVTLDQKMGHDAPPCMRVSGRQRAAWNFASLTLETPILPGSRYRLSGWMRVTSWEGPSKGPYLKIGLTDGKAKWLANCNTDRYDLRRRGEWQRLSVAFETSAEVRGGHLAIEKGGRDLTITADMQIDDVTLELLAAP